MEDFNGELLLTFGSFTLEDILEFKRSYCTSSGLKPMSWVRKAPGHAAKSSARTAAAPAPSRVDQDNDAGGSRSSASLLVLPSRRGTGFSAGLQASAPPSAKRRAGSRSQGVKAAQPRSERGSIGGRTPSQQQQQPLPTPPTPSPSPRVPVPAKTTATVGARPFEQAAASTVKAASPNASVVPTAVTAAVKVSEETQQAGETAEKAARAQQQCERLRKERREKAGELLARLREKHEFDKERARRSYTESSFEVAVVQYSEAIASLEDVVCHIRLHGDVDVDGSSATADVEGKRLAPLFWSRADVQGYLGRFLSAAGDCALALAHDRGFDQAYPRMGKALLMAGELKQADDAFRLGMREDTDCERHKDCRLGRADVHAVSVHLENAQRAVQRKDITYATECAKRALTISPNLEAAQKLLLGVLMEEHEWEEARRSCEVWAYKRDRCMGGCSILGGYAKGGRPPRLVLRVLHATIREGYVKSLRNTGRMDAFEGALDEASGMGLPWAKKMTCQRREAMEKKDRAGEAYAAGRYRSAVDFLTEALAIGDEGVHTNAFLHAKRAAALMHLGKNKDALEDCAQALRLKPNYPEVLLRKARLLSRLGFWEEAVEDYGELLLNSDVPTWAREQAASEMREARVNLQKLREEQRRREQQRRREEQCRRDEEEQRRREEEEAKARSRSRDHERASRRITGGHYATLGLKSCATTAEIKRAYRELARQLHPDKTGGDAALAEQMKALNTAYEVLSDEAERRTYDAYLCFLARRA